VGDDGSAVIGNDHNLHAVIEREGFSERLSGGKRAGKNGKQEQTGKSGLEPAAVETHEGEPFAVIVVNYAD
jgi:hypothetical protein